MADCWHGALRKKNELDILMAGGAGFPIWYLKKIFPAESI
jgi:hypothetical protein